MKRNAKKNSIVVLLILISFLFSSQALALVSGQQIWREHYGGDYLNGRPTVMVKDDKDNLYVAGTYDNGIIIIKYDSVGNQRWARKYPGLNINNSASVVVDKDSSVYVTGSRYSGGYYGEEIALLKYSSVGNLQWVRKYGSRQSWGSASGGVVRDSKDNIYVAGSNRNNFILIKYDKFGRRLWARQYDKNDRTYSFANRLAIDKDDNLFISGITINLRRYYQDQRFTFSVIKYSSSGTRKWITNIKDYDFEFEFYNDRWPHLAADPFGNAIVAFSGKGPDGTRDYQVVKIGSNGMQKWKRSYDSGDDSISALTVDGLGNIYATGQTVRRVGKIIDQDFCTVKFDKKGNRRWARKFDGSGTNDNYIVDGEGYYPSYDAFYPYGQLKDRAVGIIIGNNNSVYVTGIINAGNKRKIDIALVKYDSQGKQRWARTFNSAYRATDAPASITRDVAGNIYVAGNSSKLMSYRDYGYPFYFYYGSEMSRGKFTILKYSP